MGCSEAGSTANTAVRTPFPSSRHPRQRTRSPSSHNTERLLAPPAPRDEDEFICRTPRSRQWPNLGLQRLAAPLACPADRLPPHRGRFHAAKACGSSTSETRWPRSPQGGRYLAASAKKQRAPWGLCEVRPGCSRLSVDATLRRYGHRIQCKGKHEVSSWSNCYFFFAS